METKENAFQEKESVGKRMAEYAVPSFKKNGGTVPSFTLDSWWLAVVE